nr:uncharacterized protein LOC100215679 [Hydra vulgaris]XP_047133732.1 uncharacterized protein LOC100215679 [Hydra vulgaris]XP_047133733.1 uncharacterized protein LOC100215679 [Hydra vulgaris]XP_047133734.1 uncharacterized protein LOC100215679 [Hydra vulgaris]
MRITKDKEQVFIPIGSFRCEEDTKKYLPCNIYNQIFDEISDGLKLSELVQVNKENVYLNHAAFGRAYRDVVTLSLLLKSFAEENPDVFYDQLCLPLTNYTYKILYEFFKSENVLLVPNCTFGMNAVQDYLIKEKKYSTAAILNPIYGATRKQLETLEYDGFLSEIVYISPGINALLEENPSVILTSLTKAYNECNFEILFCDAIASQSGRILPLKEISSFCALHKITFVVDGTQCCELLFEDNIQLLDHVDYFVMSTHKWIGNTKSCGIIRFKNIEACPRPPAISFGWDNSEGKSHSQIKAGYMWLGMLDTYISYITLSKAIKIFKKYGRAQLQYAASLLNRGLLNNLGVKPLLPETNDRRVINIFDLKSCQFSSIKNLNDIQKAFQEYGLFVSVKSTDQDCFNNKVLNKDITETTKEEKRMNLKNDVRNGINSYIAKEEQETEIPVCTRSFNKYIRISCWSYNTIEDFEYFANICNNNLYLSKTTDAGLRRQFLHIYDLYEKLFSVLKTKAFFIRAERLRHHLIFYYAHTAVLYINKLVVSGYLDSKMRIDPFIESIMSVGVDEMSWDDLLEDNYVWSKYSDEQLAEYLNKIKIYRQQVKKLILQLLDNQPINLPINPSSLHWVILMGIEHEKIHLETSAVIISQVPLHLIKKKHNFNFLMYKSEKTNKTYENLYTSCKNVLVDIPGGKVLMGKDNLESDFFGWDNEFGSEEKILKPFRASQMLVSNAEYLEFVEAGGYTEYGKKWWSTEGWRYVTDLNVTMPRFWVNKFTYRLLLEEIPMPWDFPVEVNNLEAEAFCNWKSESSGVKVRLISHEESFHMRLLVQNETSNTNLNKFGSPTPVNLYGGLIAGKMVYDVSGNVWRHSVSVLTIMNGFKMDPLYDDYTLPTIDGFHNHILGGSWISLGNLANVNARYGFRRHFYQYAGIRYVESENSFHNRVHKMFDNLVIGEKLTEHYTDFNGETLVKKKPVLNWPYILGNKTAELINQNIRKNNQESKLKILIAYGGAGRVTLEILRNCSNLEIEFTDKTANNLQLLESLLRDSSVSWFQKLEGEITESKSYHLEPTECEKKLLDEKNNTILFFQADYKNMKPTLKDYDLVVADFRYKNAHEELLEITKRLKINGLLVLGSIDDVNTELFDTNHSLSVLKNNFECLENISEHPHIYKETRNKHKYAISYLSIWKKVSDFVKSTHVPSVDDEDILTTAQYYEDENILSSYEVFHYGDGLLSVKNFPLHIAEVCIKAALKYKTGLDRALDAGCGPGRTAIELSGTFKQVMAYDYSNGFVELMNTKKKERNILNLVTFQGDCHNQKEICDDKMFDLILGCNLIDRLHSPQEWLIQSKGMLKKNGILVISSPYTWLKEHTAVNKWIGGIKKNGENYFTLDGLKEILSPELALYETISIPFVIPDADGTYQYTYSNCTIFGAVK